METYFQKNRAKKLAYARKRYAENPEYQKKWRAEHPEKTKIYRQRRIKKQKDYYEKWYKENGRNRADNYKECIFEWEQANPEKVKIKKQLYKEVKKGTIKRPEICPRCGRKARIQAHHFNYNHFMNFVWLCASCHKLKHNNQK